jgi:hypothetical protein
MKLSLKYLFIISIITACTDAEEKKEITSVPVATGAELDIRWKMIKALNDTIQEGDLVVRCGNDFTSESLRDFSQQEKLYSHSGIAFLHNGVMYIYSNMAGDLNPDEVMRRDVIDSFLTPVNNVAMGVYRYDLSDAEIQTLKSIVLEHYRNKLQFDMNFDLSTDDKMYCVEMIAKAVEKATENRIVFTKSMVNEDLRSKYLKMALQKKVLPSAKAADQREYLAIDNLYLNPHCREVSKYVFGAPKKPIPFPSPENDSN